MAWPTPAALENLDAIQALLNQTFSQDPQHAQRTATQNAINACRAHPEHSPGHPPYSVPEHEGYVEEALSNAQIASGYGSAPPDGAWAPVITDLQHGNGGGSGGSPSESDLSVMVASLVLKHGNDLGKVSAARKLLREWMREHWPRYPRPPMPTPERLKAIKDAIKRGKALL